MYLCSYVCGYTERPENGIICLPSLLLPRQGLSLNLISQINIAEIFHFPGESHLPPPPKVNAGIIGRLPKPPGLYVGSGVQTLVLEVS